MNNKNSCHCERFTAKQSRFASIVRLLRQKSPRNGIKFLWLVCVMTISAIPALAQTGRITVASTPNGAAVYVDSLLAGTTPLDRHEIPAGIRQLKIVYPSATSWPNISKTETIEVTADSEARYTFELGSLLTLSTQPSGVTVVFRDRPLGVTPLYYQSADPISGTLLLRKDGYEQGTVMVTPEMPFPPLVTLRPTAQNTDDMLPDILPPDYENGSSSQWTTYAAAASMIVSGVLSAYWKNQANRDFDKFVETGDPALLASTQRLDHRAGISITVSHVSFTALAYLLLSE